MFLNAKFDIVSTSEQTLLSGNVLSDNGNGPDAGGYLVIAEVNGVAASVGQQITLASGALLTLNSDGSFDYDPNGAFDHLPDGASTPDTFLYTLEGTDPGTFASSLELSALDGSNGFVINGINAADGSGHSVSSAGDINGDGIDDLIIGASYADPNGSASGESYVVFGTSAGFGSSLELSALDGSSGFVLNGIDADDESGDSVSSAGDINGFGIDDVIIGGWQADPNGVDSGESYVVFGTSAGFGASLELSALDGANGFVINGIDAGDNSGYSVSSAGDINGDGIDDLIIGAWQANPNGSASGESYVVFGNSAGFDSSLDLSALDGSNGFVLNGIDADDRSGFSVSSAGDINGDGIDDLIIGARRAAPNGIDSGESYVVFGTSAGVGASLDLSSLDGSNGFVLNGIDANDLSGRSVSSAGDINGDGIDDLIIGAASADPNGGSSGESYVVFGTSAGFASSLELSALDGSNGFVINGADPSSLSGFSVSSAGDINGDGIDDLIIGAMWASPNGSLSGESYVVFGRGSFTASVAPVFVTVTGENNTAVAQDDAISVNADVALTGSVLADNGAGADSDPDTGAVLSVLEVNGVSADIGPQITLASGALLTLNSDGTFDYDPNGVFQALAAGASDTDSFTYALTDGSITRTPGIFNAVLELSALDGSNGFVLNGTDAFDGSGYSVSSAGDVNGDGIDDLIIGARDADPAFRPYAGESYVVFGSSAGFSSDFELSALDGSNGFVITGIDILDYSGASVSSAGDVNGDGIDDMIIGAWAADPNGSEAGESYVVFGSSAGFGSSLELLALDGSNGFVINGIDADDQSGYSVSSAGDINGDGIDDLIIGARNADPNGSNSGESYVVFGTSAGFGSSLELSALNGANGFVINGIDADDQSGYSVSSAGDINGDGIDDLIIGARNADPNGGSSGESYVVFGNSAGFGASLDLSALDGSNGFVINGIASYNLSGFSVSSAGDINGDGIDDLIIGAPAAFPNGSASGESYVVFGTSAGLGASLELSALNGTNGFVINGIDADDLSGYSVSSAGDINGDGIDDLIIGALGADPNGSYSGESYVVFGTSAGFGSSLELSSLDGTNGFVINGRTVGDRSGISVASAGDINGDGIDDLIIGASTADANGNFAGESYVVLGRAVFTPVVDVATVTVTINGVNDAPVAVDDLLVTTDDEESVLTRSVFPDSGPGQDTDPDNGAALTVIEVNGSSADIGQQITLASGSLLTMRSDGTFDHDTRGVFDYLAVGTQTSESFTYRISDGLGGEDTATVTINILGRDDPSVAQDDAFATNAGDVVSGQVLADNGSGPDSDIDADAVLSVVGINSEFANVGSQITLASGALLTLNSDGTFDYDPNGAFDALAAGSSDLDAFSYFLTGGATLKSPGIFGAVTDLSALDGFNGFAINGVGSDDISGYSVSSAGDVNGDGIDDVIVGAPRADPNGPGSGESYVIFGSSTGFDADVELSALDGSNGFVINGISTGDNSGRSVSSAGDVNGDGIDDLIIGADYVSTNGTRSGASYVVFGNSAGFVSSLELSALDGSNGFVINGDDASDRNGYSVSSAGDVNGDGIDDLIIGARDADPPLRPSAGESYVVFGSSAGFSSDFELSALDGSNGFVITGIDALDYSGASVSSAGDVNGDGIDDMIIGAWAADPNGSEAGESYVVFGSSAGFSPTLDLASLDGSNGFVVRGIGLGDRSGFSVSSAGDVNGDGIDDVIIGAYGGDQNGNQSGESYVIFGSASGFASSLDLSALNGINGFVINGRSVGDKSSISVASAGDINGDGIDDLIIGASTADANGNFAGESYVVFGTSAGFGASFDLNTLDGTNGFALNGIDGGDFTGASVSAAGDVNGDGIDDLIVGAKEANPNGVASGQSYVILGSAEFSPIVVEGVVNVTVNGVNDAPVAQDDALVVAQDGALVGASVFADNGAGVDSDPDNGATITVTEVNGLTANVGTQITLASGALLALNSDGTFDYDPNGAFDDLALNTSGSDSFVYRISDGLGGEDVATATVTINGGNDAPTVAGPLTAEGTENGSVVVVNLLEGASDLDVGETAGLQFTNVLYSIDGGAQSAPSVLSSDGVVVVGANLRVDPLHAAFDDLALDQDRVITVSYTIRDAQAATVAQTATVTITGTNDLADFAGALTGSIDEAGGVGNLSDPNIGGITGTVTATDVDGPDNSFVAVGPSVSNMGYGTYSINAGGIWTYALDNDNAAVQALVGGDVLSDTFTVTAADLTTQTVTITIDGSDDAPVVGGLGASVAIPEQTSVAVLAGVLVDDVDGAALASATVAITGGFVAGEDVLGFVNIGTLGNITGSFAAGTGILTLTSAGGTAMLDEWQAALGAVTYTNTSDSPDSAPRTLSISVNDGVLDSPAANQTVTINRVNDVPVLGGLGAVIAASEQVTQGALPDVTLSDLDSGTLASATVAVTGGFVTGEDVLGFVNAAGMGNVAGSFDIGTGVLTLTSAGATATLAEWQEALRVVSYTNTSDTPDTSDRTLSVVVNDGADDSVLATQTITVAAVNDLPEALGNLAPLTTLEETATDVDLSFFFLVDADAPASFSLIVTAVSGILSATTSGGVTVVGSGSSTVSLTGSIAGLNAYLVVSGALQYTGALDVFGDAADTLSFTADDAGILTGLGSVPVTIGDVVDIRPGTAGADDLVGDDGRDSLTGGLGRDTLRGGGGADTLIGDQGIDTADYSTSTGAVALRLWTGLGFGGDAEGDVLSGIETLIGSDHADTLVGNFGQDNLLEGGQGDDLLKGLSGNDTLRGGGGADTLQGDQGFDTVDYSASTGAVAVRLWTGPGIGGDAAGDVLTDIEHLIGSDQNDILVGDFGQDNRLEGGLGDDQLKGLSGNDLLRGDDGADTLQGDAWNDTLEGGADNDLLSGGADTDVLRGGSGQDSLTGGLGQDFLTGGADADSFIFADVTETLTGATRDQIVDFEQGLDVIDVSGMSLGLFSFVGMGPITGANQIRVIETATGSSIVQFNIDADLAVDAEIRIANVTGLTADDFAL